MIGWACAFLALFAIPLSATAAGLDVITRVAGPLASYYGGDVGSIFEAVMVAFIVIVDVVGIMIIARAGLNMTLRQGDDEFSKGKKTIGAAAAALILINLAPSLKAAFLSIAAGGGAGTLSDELIGVADFFATLAGIAAIIFIIVNGLRAISGFDGGDGAGHFKSTLISILIGMTIIGLKVVIANAVVTERTPNSILSSLAKVVEAVLGICAIIAVTVLIYAGFMMVINFGREEAYTRAKGILIRVAIGLLVILSSLAIVHFVID